MANTYVEVLGRHVAPAIDTLRHVRFAMFEPGADSDRLYEYTTTLSYQTLSWVIDFINGSPRTLAGNEIFKAMLRQGTEQFGPLRPESQFGRDSAAVATALADKAYEIASLGYGLDKVPAFVQPRPDTTSIEPEIWLDPKSLVVAPTVRSYLWALLYQHFAEVSARGTTALAEDPMQQHASAQVDPIFLSSDLSRYYLNPRFSDQTVEAVNIFVQGSQTGRTLAHTRAYISEYFMGAAIL